MKRNLVYVGLTTALITSLFYVTSVDSNTKPSNVITLSDNNTVSLNLPITDGTANNISLELMEKNFKLAKGKPIYLVLNSPGGSIPAGQHIIDIVEGLGRPVHTISLFSASMSFVISQYLNDRYVLEDTTMMAHRARAGGLEGEIPGSLMSRAFELMNMMTVIDEKISLRVGIPVKTYRDWNKNELWMHGEQAKELAFADRVVKVTCDRSLMGLREPELFDIMFFRVRVTFHKCPLITAPVSMSIETSGQEASVAAESLFYDKAKFVEEYIVPNRYNIMYER